MSSTSTDRHVLAGATVLGALASASGVALTATAGWLIVQASTRPAVLTLLLAVVGVRAFGLARPVLRYVERLRAHDAALRMLARRRVEVYDALVPLVPGRLGRRRGDLLTAVVDDVDSVVDRELRVRMPARQLTLVALIAGSVAFVLHPVAGAIVLGSVLVSGTGAFWIARLGSGRAERVLVGLRSELSTSVVEAVQLADELRMWQRSAATADRVAATSARIGAVTTRAALWLGLARGVVLVTAGGAMAAVAAVTVDDVSAGRLSGPVMALLVLLPLALADVTLPLADAGALSARTAAAAERLEALERTSPAVADTPGRAAVAGHGLAARDVRGRWDLRAPQSAPVTLDLRAGRRIGVVGPSGSGKSTLAALVLRFLDPCAGELRLGGLPVGDLGPDDVRGVVGLVDDHPHVFATTLVENVRLARPDATDAEVVGALHRARLGGWVDGLPDGIDTWLGDGHAAVSGGERARIGIARSLLAEHPVLVLDEPSAHLDSATARELAEEVLSADDGRSVLWITHDPTGLDLVDETVTLRPELATVQAEGPGAERRRTMSEQRSQGQC
ncbi:MAG TPA: thiol reductant ABC exporter subunit CydC [Nocardioides sp.]|nr:thiol reductant ABC exporter subunit CydC [Nocardioides sp.]